VYCIVLCKKAKKWVKADIALSGGGEPHLRATGRHLPYGITQCNLPPDTSERAPPNPSQTGRYLIYLPWRDGRLSWPSWFDSAPTGSRTSELVCVFSRDRDRLPLSRVDADRRDRRMRADDSRKRQLPLPREGWLPSVLYGIPNLVTDGDGPP